MKNFVIDEVKTISAIHSQCPVCGFENPKEEMFRTCPMCNANLVLTTANISEGEPFCVCFALG